MAKIALLRASLSPVLTILTVLILYWAQAAASSSDPETDPRFVEGKEQYKLTVARSREPLFGHCWRDALFVLEAGCKRLSDDVQHRLALKFANCLFVKNGLDTYPCENGESFEDCTRDMSPQAFVTYTHFFTHTHNMCFFLEAQVWREQTDVTINRLAETSSEVVQRIEDSSQLQNEVILKQNESLENQKIFLQRGSELKRLLEESTLDVHKMLEEFEDSTSEQRQLIFQVFDKLSALQSIVMGEFTGFYSLLFYTMAILVSYMLSSTPRTSGSRFWLFLLMTVNVIVERLLTYVDTSQTLGQDGDFMDENAVVYSRLWWCRKTFTSAAILVWIYFAYTYKDLNQINNQLLEQIKKQNSDLKRLLQTPAENGATGQSPPEVRHCKEKSPTVHDVSSDVTADHINSSTGYETDTDYSSDIDSQATDRTFTCHGDADLSDTESCSSFFTSSSFAGRMSRESTPSLLTELRDLRQATPLREMTPIPGVTVAETSLDNSQPSPTGSGRRRGRPRGSGRRSVPLLPSERPVISYNLRSRRGLARVSENPVVHTESAEDFTKVIRHLSGVASRNTAKVNATVDRHGGARLFSSDED